MMQFWSKVMTSEVEERPRLVTPGGHAGWSRRVVTPGGHGRHGSQWIKGASSRLNGLKIVS